ncbi:hypothetical protein LTR99_007842 [Exophiala xenobiotica]|nr:hypothetical protein LTR92_003412 [Exophiala xenobiotica]KAK5223819.1 hypothetical protein LTR72_005205 [Exophiala xenobiotica]KAK5289220.1 hypothetical protein LTR14_007471 [Exophiala xenobiotica]KAK5298153.1 hypothetical protein LTR99_007842 [Exophiala xenobiotica]KAK5338194.1 hypothetical protein LTR98_006043 [Exophiala xenobiotica]
MPPPRGTPPPSQGYSTDTAFGRAHPKVMKGLIVACQFSGPLLIGTLLWTAGFLKRPMWERVMMWRAYLWTYISRWVLVSCAITWTLNGWGPQDEGEGQGMNTDPN